MARNVGQPMLTKVMPTRAKPTVPQAVMSTENTTSAANPPATEQPATTWARRFIAATGPAMVLTTTTPIPKMASGTAVSPTLRPCSLIRNAAR